MPMVFSINIDDIAPILSDIIVLLSYKIPENLIQYCQHILELADTWNHGAFYLFSAIKASITMGFSLYVPIRKHEVQLLEEFDAQFKFFCPLGRFKHHIDDLNVCMRYFWREVKAT